MPLLSLPVEILLIVIQSLDDPSLSALTRTNKRLHAYFTNELYRRSLKTDGWALHWASYNNQVGTARRFLKLGGSPNIWYRRDYDSPYVPLSLPLIGSVLRNDLEMATLLLGYGANVDMQDCCGATALYMASKLRHQSMVHLLLDNGANIIFSYGFHHRQYEIEKRLETCFPSLFDSLKRGVPMGPAELPHGEVP